MAEYWRLRRFLERQRADKIVLSFEELEGILGHPLPPSARKHRAWWGNWHGHSQARAWLEAGWKVLEVDLAGEEVVFGRVARTVGIGAAAERGEGTGRIALAPRQAGGAWGQPTPQDTAATCAASAEVREAAVARGIARGWQASGQIAQIAGDREAPAGRLSSLGGPARTRGAARPALEITDRNRLLKIFRLFAALDAVRWQSADNYNVINYSVSDLSGEQKLLCHWICYITDRQMPFRIVWEVGGYVLSHAVRVFAEGGTEAVLRKCLQRFESAQGMKWRWVAPLGEPNEVLRRRGVQRGPVEFASRLMPADTVSIVRTLQFLEECCQRSLGQFLARVLAAPGDGVHKTNRLAAALHVVSYAGVGRPGNAQLAAAIQRQREAAAREAAAFAEDCGAWLEGCLRRFRPARYGSKRLWAALRDWIKSPEFNPLFVQALRQAGAEDAEQWAVGGALQKPALAALELPGDVWNNNPRLMGGLIAPCIWPVPQKPNASLLMRQLYEMSGAIDEGMYPEQFDVTFDFAPRMCAQDMCTACPFGGGPQVLCRPAEGQLCPAVRTWCGYFYPCPGLQACPFLGLETARLCASQMA